MFAGITLNSSLTLTVRIHEVTRIQVPEDKSIDTLLICHCEDKEFYDFLLGMGVWSETISISVEGED